MSGAELLVDRDGPLLRAARVVNGALEDLHIDHTERPSRLGSVFLGRVSRIVPSLDGAFVDIGVGQDGLLSASDARAATGRVEKIGTALRAGQTVLVQVKADAVGSKGPALTMDVTLPGRFLVHALLVPGVVVSKRIGDAAARARLRDLVEASVSGIGWIARAAALGAEPAVLAMEADALAAEGRDLRDAAGPAPRCLLTGPDAAQRALIEAATAPEAIIVDDDESARTLAAWCAERAPDLAGRIRRHTGREPLFSERDLEAEIAGLRARRVPLPGGGSLVIERTEALWVVDVNGGDRGNALAINQDAADELARQLRLRNIGGVIVVDFINMRNRGDDDRLLAHLARAVEADPVQTEVYGLSKLGLVEMTRARRGPALAELLSDQGE